MYKISTLKNGLRLVTAPIGGTKTATVLVLVGTGSKYETRETSGISHFLEHMFFKGTKKRPSTLALSSELDTIGIFNAFTSKEYTGFWVKANSARLNAALELVSDMLLNSLFNSREIVREKGVIIEELNMVKDDYMRYVDDIFEVLLYGDTPAGWEILGSVKTINSFKRKDFLSYLKAQYAIHNTTVCVAGNIGKNTEVIKKQVSKYFSTKELKERGQNFQEKIKVKEKQDKPRIYLRTKKIDQTHISLGVRTLPYDHPDTPIVKIIGAILGGSMSARMFINLRERQGLAYYVHSFADEYSDSGYLTTKAGVPAAKIDIVLKTILREYKKLTTTLVGAKELKKAKDIISSRMAIRMEASDEVAGLYAQQAVMEDTLNRTRVKAKAFKLESPEVLLKKLTSVSATDIRRVAREIFVNKGLNLAVIGPFKDGGKLEKILRF